MAVTTLIAPQVVPAGSIGPSSGVPISAAPQDHTLILHILSNDWTTNESGLEISFQIDFSFDDGSTWEPQGSGTCLGGSVGSRTGLLPSISCPIPANTAIQFRGSATLNQAANSLGLGYEVL